MKKFWFVIISLLVSLNAFGQNQNHKIKVCSISTSTERQAAMNSRGSFNMSGFLIKGGTEFSRSGYYGNFGYGAFMGCLPCQKGTVLGGFGLDGWLTGGQLHQPNEWTTLNGLSVEVLPWSIPVQHPRNRLLTKYVPVRVTGTVRVTDGRSSPDIITYVDEEVDLRGIMKVNFTQERFDPKLFGWKDVEVNVSAENCTPN